MKIDKVKKEISPKEGKEKRKKINQTTILLKKNFSTDRQTDKTRHFTGAKTVLCTYVVHWVGNEKMRD